MAEQDRSAAVPFAAELGARFAVWAARVDLSRRLAVLLTIAAFVAGLATYAAISGSFSPLAADPTTILIMLNIDLALLLALVALVAWRLVRLWIERRQGSVGSRLHVRMVAIFSLLAVAPAIVVALFSLIFFSLGIQSWFNERVSTALDRSLAVAEAYLHDHREFIRADILSMVNALNRTGPRLLENADQFNQAVDRLVTERSLSEAIVLRGDGKVLARSKLSFVLEFDPIPNAALQRALNGEVVTFTSDNSDRVRALARIDSIVGTYLYVGRFVDSAVINHMERLRRAVDEYRALEVRRSGFQITFTMVYVTVALLLLAAAVWLGLNFANRLARPIAALAAAAEQVRAGDLSVRVPEIDSGDEIASLGRAFNRMTDQIESQRAELIEANNQLDTRRRFTEAVLLGVSAGVLGLDPAGTIFLPNRSALDLLACSRSDLVGRPLAEAVPEMAALLESIRDGGERSIQDQVSILRGGRSRTLVVRVTSEHETGEGAGFVVTFDDITDLVTAQRAAAWRDVARRIAHEIKNPLTPIQLAAERLRRKYLKEIRTDPDVFTVCLDTIGRQVADIRRMVDEFSAFARMPAPIMVKADLVEVVKGVVSIQEIADPDIAFVTELPASPVVVRCDPRQIGRALTNLLLNSEQAIHARDAMPDQSLPPGRIVVSLREVDEDHCVISVRDNGRGLPMEFRDRLTEPYVTTRSKGTGLGLAIVKKIMEDHGGVFELDDNAQGGAFANLVFHRRAHAASGAGDEVKQKIVADAE